MGFVQQSLLSETGVHGEYHYSGSLNAHKFIVYLENVALPLWGTEQVLMMDRHPVHCAQTVRNFLRNHHIDYLYLPPYSPELNPIEEAFSKVKNSIKRHKPRTLRTRLRAMKESLHTVTLQDIMGYFNHAELFLINAY
jgi:transposase